MTIQTIPIEQIVIPEVRSNAVYSPEKWAEFVESIRPGIQYPPDCRRLPDGRVELVDGLHRILAWKELGHTEIDADVKENMSDEEATVRHLVANHQRGESDPVGLSKIILKLKDQGRSAADIGKLIGYSDSTVRLYAFLSSLKPEYQEAITAGKLKMAHIKEVTRLDDVNDINSALSYAIQFGWTASALHYAVENRLAELQQPVNHVGADPGLAPPPQDFSANLAQYRQCLSCGSNDEAQNMSYWQICKGCHDALMYLKQIDRLPWNAIQKIAADQEALFKENEELKRQLQEASKQIYELTMRISRQITQGPQQQAFNQNTNPAAGQIPGIPSWAGIPKQ